MAKKTKKKHSKEHPIISKFNISRTEAEHVEKLIKASERCVTGMGSTIDELFAHQAKRLKVVLEQLRKNK